MAKKRRGSTKIRPATRQFILSARYKAKKHTKNNLIDVPEKTTSSFAEASIKI
jgi:hypothetical protein